MKNHYLLLPYLILTLFSFNSFAQATLNERGFSFQGYARNNDGAALSSENIEVQFTIYQQGQTAEFTEVQTATTDAFGVFHLIIGSISTADFKALDFAKKNDYKLKVETRVIGGTYATISDAFMESVPYAQAADNGVPVGSMIIFGGPKANIPAGWLACDGRAYASADYPKLFAALGTSWGNGSTGTGGTTGQFNVPDMRGLFARGVNDGSNRDPNAADRVAHLAGGNTGDKVGTFQEGSIQSHNHSVNIVTNTTGAHTHQITKLPLDSRPGVNVSMPHVTESSGSDEYWDGVIWSPGDAMTSNGNHAHSVDGTTGGSGGNETRGRNVAVWYIIRAR